MEFGIYNLLIFLTLPWVIVSLLSTACDVGVGFLDELLLQKIDERSAEDEADAPTQLLLMSGLFGFVISVMVALLATVSPLTLSFTISSLYPAFAAGVLEIAWLVPYFYAIHRSGAMTTTPLLQTIPIFSLIFGIIFFAEIPLWQHVIAATCIVIGGLLLNYSPSMRALDIKTIYLMLLASSIISLGFFLFKGAAEISNFATAVFGNGLGMGAFSVAIWTVWKPLRQHFFSQIKNINNKILSLQILTESLYAAATLLNQLALVLGPSVMLVSSLAALHPIFTLAGGAVLAKYEHLNYSAQFQDKHNKITNVIGIIAITLGALLIAT